MQVASGPRETEGPCNCHEVAEVPDVHLMTIKLQKPVIKEDRSPKKLDQSVSPIVHRLPTTWAAWCMSRCQRALPHVQKSSGDGAQFPDRRVEGFGPIICTGTNILLKFSPLGRRMLHCTPTALGEQMLAGNPLSKRIKLVARLGRY